jgi:PhnB protein
MAAKKSVKKAAAKIQAKAKSARAKVIAKAAQKASSARAKAASKAGPKKVQPIPPGMPSVVPNLVVQGAGEAIDFYKRALGAKEVMRQLMPGSDLVWHAQLKIGDSVLFINDGMPGGSAGSSASNPSHTSMWLWCKDVNSAFNTAVAAGAKVTMPLMDQFWGDRMGMVTDRWGITWAFSQHVRDMTPEQMQQAGEAFAKSQPPDAMGDMPPPSGGNGTEGSTGGAMA